MELQKAAGVLGQKIDHISSDVAAFGAKLDATCNKVDDLRRWQALVTGGAVVIAAVIGILWTVFTFVPWDRIEIKPSQTIEAKR